MTKDRWDRLAADLTASGFTAIVDRKPAYNGQPSSAHIYLRIKGDRVTIADSWWSKNTSTWIGWQAWSENKIGICQKSLRPSKKRSDVVKFIASL